LNAPVVPVTIRYSDRSAYWTDNIPLARHLWTRVLKGVGLTATIHLGTLLRAQDFSSVEELAAAVYESVCRPIVEHGELA
jgi:hypothetical protein